MKFCSKACNSLYIGLNGRCSICGWSNVYIGNLYEQSFEEIWNGEKIKQVRDAMKKGDFRYCNCTSCPNLENNDLPDLSEQEIDEKFNEYELKCVELAYDKICNHSCPSCRNEIFVPDEKELCMIKTLNDKVLPLINNSDEVIFSGSGDIFASKYALELAENFNPVNKNCKVGIQTNGALFDEKHWEKISHLKEYNLSCTITPNSYNRINYEYINGGHDTYDALIKNLKFVKGLREKNYIKKLELSIVVQERNFMDLPEFIERSINEFGCDKVIIKPLYKWFFITEENFWYKDILNPLHPYHKQYMEMLNSPIIDNPKVYLWGAKNLHKPSQHPAYKYYVILGQTALFLMPLPVMKLVLDRKLRKSK